MKILERKDLRIHIFLEKHFCDLCTWIYYLPDYFLVHGLLHFFRCVEKATETDPSNPEAWQTRARLHIIKSEFKVRRQDCF